MPMPVITLSMTELDIHFAENFNIRVSSIFPRLLNDSTIEEYKKREKARLSKIRKNTRKKFNF